ncbi:hypothetical protein L228DRAFT_121010 [Xylona heveae TC161]|uniref:Uncharacterized protein n=1 Tax=Xylona heveae (strain CBS 132557 / TC161) TaxID=1328760 RepID=A0A165HJT5_XYLHT|nr:hypothetical protein L228DRAFT_121010 [Xylona heveae TC161]KZF23621.1 hypothetical protein L228DRAFT_121010 [Xylona heveae TC161]
MNIYRINLGHLVPLLHSLLALLLLLIPLHAAYILSLNFYLHVHFPASHFSPVRAIAFLIPGLATNFFPRYKCIYACSCRQRIRSSALKVSIYHGTYLGFMLCSNNNNNNNNTLYTHLITHSNHCFLRIIELYFLPFLCVCVTCKNYRVFREEKRRKWAVGKKRKKEALVSTIKGKREKKNKEALRKKEISLMT